MLRMIGERQVENPSVADRLLECHARIRRFCALAVRLSAGGPADQAREAAEQLVRYFGVALPLHVADEDESVRPRLERLGDPIVGAALAVMSREHVEIDATLVSLLDAWRAIARESTDARCFVTRDAALVLERTMLPHLEAEERVVFPTFAALPLAELDAIVAEMKARRRA